MSAATAPEVTAARPIVVPGVTGSGKSTATRRITRTLTRARVCNGDRESLRQAFSRDSILLRWANTWRERHRAAARYRSSPDLPRTLVPRTPRELDALLADRGIRTGRWPSSCAR